MLEKINKIPAGTFLVPMIVSMIVHTFWPNLFHIGGLSEALFSGSGTAFISGMLSFAAGTRITLERLKNLMKHQGTLVLIKVVIATLLSFAFLYFFGDEGIWGISGVAFLAVMFSLNPAVQVSILQAYGYEEDFIVIGLATAVTLPILPMIVYSVYSSGSFAGIDWLPIISALLPLAVGMIFGSIDRNFEKLFAPSVGVLLPFLGWNLGQSMNFIEALSSGFSGLLLTALFIAAFSVLYLVDTKILGYDGISGIAMIVVAGVSTIVPPTIAAAFPAVEPYVTAATAQILLASIITSILFPFLAGRRYFRIHGEITK